MASNAKSLLKNLMRDLRSKAATNAKENTSAEEKVEVGVEVAVPHTSSGGDVCENAAVMKTLNLMENLLLTKTSALEEEASERRKLEMQVQELQKEISKIQMEKQMEANEKTLNTIQHLIDVIVTEDEDSKGEPQEKNKDQNPKFQQGFQKNKGNQKQRGNQKFNRTHSNEPNKNNNDIGNKTNLDGNLNNPNLSKEDKYQNKNLNQNFNNFNPIRNDIPNQGYSTQQPFNRPQNQQHFNQQQSNLEPMNNFNPVKNFNPPLLGNPQLPPYNPINQPNPPPINQQYPIPPFMNHPVNPSQFHPNPFPPQQNSFGPDGNNFHQPAFTAPTGGFRQYPNQGQNVGYQQQQQQQYRNNGGRGGFRGRGNPRGRGNFRGGMNRSGDNYRPHNLETQDKDGFVFVSKPERSQIKKNPHGNEPRYNQTRDDSQPQNAQKTNFKKKRTRNRPQRQTKEDKEKDEDVDSESLMQGMMEMFSKVIGNMTSQPEQKVAMPAPKPQNSTPRPPNPAPKVPRPPVQISTSASGTSEQTGAIKKDVTPGKKPKPKKTNQQSEGKKDTKSNPLKLFVGSGIPTEEEAKAKKINLDLEVKDLMLVAKNEGNTIMEQPKTLRDMTNFKKKYPNASAIVIKG